MSNSCDTYKNENDAPRLQGWVRAGCWLLGGAAIITTVAWQCVSPFGTPAAFARVTPQLSLSSGLTALLTLSGIRFHLAQVASSALQLAAIVMLAAQFGRRFATGWACAIPLMALLAAPVFWQMGVTINYSAGTVIGALFLQQAFLSPTHKAGWVAVTFAIAAIVAFLESPLPFYVLPGAFVLLFEGDNRAKRIRRSLFVVFLALATTRLVLQSAGLQLEAPVWSGVFGIWNGPETELHQPYYTLLMLVAYRALPLILALVFVLDARYSRKNVDRQDLAFFLFAWAPIVPAVLKNDRNPWLLMPCLVVLAAWLLRSAEKARVKWLPATSRILLVLYALLAAGNITVMASALIAPRPCVLAALDLPVPRNPQPVEKAIAERLTAAKSADPAERTLLYLTHDNLDISAIRDYAAMNRRAAVMTSTIIVGEDTFSAKIEDLPFIQRVCVLGDAWPILPPGRSAERSAVFRALFGPGDTKPLPKGLVLTVFDNRMLAALRRAAPKIALDRRQIVQAGKTSWEKRDLSASLDIFRFLATAYPNDDEVVRLLAQSLTLADQTQEAKTRWTQFFRQAVSFGDKLFALDFIAEQEVIGALPARTFEEYLTPLLAQFGHDPNLRYALISAEVRFHQLRRDWPAALATLRAMRHTARPDQFPGIDLVIAHVLHSLSRDAEAMELLRRNLKIAAQGPVFADSAFLLAKLLADHGDVARAQQNIELGRTPNCDLNTYLDALLYVAGHMPPEDQYRCLVAALPHVLGASRSLLHIEIAKLALAREDKEEAKRHFTHAMKDAPDADTRRWLEDTLNEM